MDQEIVAATGVDVEPAPKKVYASRLCVKCGKEFEPNSANQKKCSTCAEKQAANTAAKKTSRARQQARAVQQAGKWNSQTKVTKSRAKEILTERGIKNPHVIDLRWELYATS